MVATSTSNKVPDNYDRKSEVKAFDETKEGVKGLVDSGMTQVPRIFHQPPKPGDQYCISSSTSDSEASQFSIPVIDLEEIDIIVEYSKQVMKLGKLLFELLSDALDLKPSHLNDINCSEALLILGHYYPSCPQTELTLGTSKHAENDFLTVLLQDHIGGHQVLHYSKWVDVLPVPGALVVNIGDLQLISNDRFKSVEPRVLANRVGPRVSVAAFFCTGLLPLKKLYGPIKELLSEDNPPKYRETTVRDYILYVCNNDLDETYASSHFKL